jgi:hypothetical protein
VDAKQSSTSVLELRSSIVRALNLTPLVPPQADDHTLYVVDEAWLALSELVRRATSNQDQGQA